MLGAVNRTRIICAAAFMLAAVFGTLSADAEITGPCAETVSKFCSDVTPGGGRIVKCLAEHPEEQSIACKDWLADQAKSLKELNSVCSEEIVKLCSSAPGGVLLFRCLDDNYVSLLSDCRGKLREIKDRMQ